MINWIEIVSKSIYKRMNDIVPLMVANETNLLYIIVHGENM